MGHANDEDTSAQNSKIEIRIDLRPGDLGRLIALHGIVYAGEASHFGIGFEAMVARTVADFVLDNDAKGRVWLAETGDELVGAAAMINQGDHGQLRWVIVKPSCRGGGLGKKLIAEAMDYAARQNWREVQLLTTDGLEAAMTIYEKLGFKILKTEPENLWGEDQVLITMVKTLEGTIDGGKT